MPSQTTRPPPGRRALVALATPLALVLALAACGNDDGGGNGAGGGEGEDSAFTVRTTEFEFDPDRITVPAGDHEATVDNTGGVVEHDFTVDELGIEIYADPGQSTTETVTFESGSYDFYCSIPGHREAGMAGTLTVE